MPVLESAEIMRTAANPLIQRVFRTFAAIPDVDIHMVPHSCSVTFSLSFRCNNIKSLFFIGRCMDDRYWQHGRNWTLRTYITDVVGSNNRETPFFYEIVSHGLTVNESWDHVRSLIDSMNHHYNHKNFMRAYDIDASLFETEELFTFDDFKAPLY